MHNKSNPDFRLGDKETAAGRFHLTRMATAFEVEDRPQSASAKAVDWIVLTDNDPFERPPVAGETPAATGE